MVAVPVEIDLRGVEPDAALTELREQIVPAFKNLPGFESGTWLSGNGGGKSLSLTLWDTEAHAQAMIHQFGLGSNHFMSASIVRAEVHEVHGVRQVWPQERDPGPIRKQVLTRPAPLLKGSQRSYRTASRRTLFAGRSRASRLRSASRPYVMAQLGHVDPKVTLGIYAKVMDRRDGEPGRLEALVEGVFTGPLDSKAIRTPAAGPADDAGKPVESGIEGA